MLDIFRSKLKKENEDLKNQMQEKDVLIEQQTEEGKKLEKEINFKTKEVIRQIRRIKELTTETSVLKKHVEDLEKENKTTSGALDISINREVEKDKEIARLKNEHCNTIERKNKELEGQRVQYEKAIKDIFDLREDKKKLIEELKRKDEMIEQYEGQIISYQRLLQNEGYIIYNPLEKQLEPIKRKEKTFEEDLERFQNYFKGQVENIQDKIEEEALYYQAERFIKTNPINVNVLEIDKNAIDIFRKLRGEMKNKKSKRFIKKYTNKMADSMERIFKQIED